MITAPTGVTRTAGLFGSVIPITHTNTSSAPLYRFHLGEQSVYRSLLSTLPAGSFHATYACLPSFSLSRTFNIRRRAGNTSAAFLVLCLPSARTHIYTEFEAPRLLHVTNITD